MGVPLESNEDDELGSSLDHLSASHYNSDDGQRITSTCASLKATQSHPNCFEFKSVRQYTNWFVLLGKKEELKGGRRQGWDVKQVPRRVNTQLLGGCCT